MQKNALKSRDKQEYLFYRREKKFTSSSRTKRRTNTGEWRTTGRDKKILQKCRTMGMKRT